MHWLFFHTGCLEKFFSLFSFSYDKVIALWLIRTKKQSKSIRVGCPAAVGRIPPVRVVVKQALEGQRPGWTGSWSVKMTRTAAALVWTGPRTGVPIKSMSQGLEAPSKVFHSSVSKPGGRGCKNCRACWCAQYPTVASKLTYKWFFFFCLFSFSCTFDRTWILKKL